jgi:hypothetical protein
MLLLIEGGFTLATNVALFKPVSQDDHASINAIMSATRLIFNKIGYAFLLIGVVASVIYSFLVKSELPVSISILTFLMTVFSTAFGLIYSSKYSILLQTEQKEYMLNYIKIGTIIFSQLVIVVLVLINGNMLLVRLVTMLGAILNSVIIGYVCKRAYKYLDFGEKPDYASIKGTKDVFIQKITSMLYSSFPIIFISASIGTVYASVYAVYNNIFILAKNIIYSFSNAPRMSFGNLIAEKDEKYVSKIFLQYEYITNYIMLCALSTLVVLIMPFISVYTNGIKDIEYKNWILALYFIGIAYFEIIHIPSGNIINMSGSFKTARQFQSIASAALIVIMLIGNTFFGLYGIMAAVLVTSILLAILEIVYVHEKYFKKTISHFLKLLLPQTVLAFLLVWLEIGLLPVALNYLQLVVEGIVILLTNCFLIFLINLLINREITYDLLYRIKSLVIRKAQ